AARLRSCGRDVAGLRHTDPHCEDVVVRPRPVRRPRLRALRLHARQERAQLLLRRLRQGLAGLLLEGDLPGRRGHQAIADRNDRAPRRPAPGHLRRTAALLLRERPEAGPDPLSERGRVRWHLARRSPERPACSLTAEQVRFTNLVTRSQTSYLFRDGSTSF